MVGTQTLKLALPTWDCLSSRSGRPEQGSPPPGARGTGAAGGRPRRGNTCSRGPPASDSCPVNGLPGLPNPSRPLPSRPVPGPLLLRSAGLQEGRSLGP